MTANNKKPARILWTIWPKRTTGPCARKLFQWISALKPGWVLLLHPGWEWPSQLAWVPEHPELNLVFFLSMLICVCFLLRSAEHGWSRSLVKGSRKYPLSPCLSMDVHTPVKKRKSGECLPASCSAHGFLHLSKVVETGRVTWFMYVTIFNTLQPTFLFKDGGATWSFSTGCWF